MRKIKAKRDSFWRRQMLPFVVVWALSIGIVGIVSRLSQAFPLPFLYNAPEERVTLSLLTSMILTGIVQVFLVERLLKRPMRGWMLYTILSVSITLFLNYVLQQLYFGPTPFPLSLFHNYGPTLALHMPISLLQFFWLRRRVNHAWLWPLLSIPFLLAFTDIDYGENYQILKGIMLLSVGVVQAGLMHYLWQHPKNTEKTKIDFAADEEERIERLQERGVSTPLWDVDDHPTLQSKA